MERIEYDYKTVDSLIAEIQAEPFFKDNPHLIDKVSIYRWVYLMLKQFGINIMQKHPIIVDVENYRGKLPENFGKLGLAAFCAKGVCQVTGNKDRLLQTYLYTDRIESKYIIENVESGDSSCETKKCLAEENQIVEKYYIHEDCEVSLYYNHPVYVNIGRKDTLDACCAKDCVNRWVRNSPYSIDIKGTQVQANFKEGSLYVEYYGLPVDEEGNPIIINSDRGYVEQYIEYGIKRRILEQAMWSQDAPNRQGVFNFTVGKEEELFRKAQSDLSPMKLDALWKAISKRRIDMKKYEINLGTNIYNTRFGYGFGRNAY